MPDPDTSEAQKQRELNIHDAMYYLMCAGISKEAREVVEAVMGGVGEYSTNKLYDSLRPDAMQHLYIWTTGMDKPTPDKPCPTCGGSEKTKPQPVGGGNYVYGNCPDCESKHFIPGKGRGL